MSLESAKKFVEKIQTDDKFAKSFFTCIDPEVRKEFITKNGFEFTREEVNQVRETIDVEGGKCCGVSCEYDAGKRCTNDDRHIIS